MYDGPSAFYCKPPYADYLQNCRFHVFYPQSTWSDADGTYGNAILPYPEDEWEDFEESLCVELDEGHIGSHSIEAVKARDILSADGWKSFCEDCEPICLSLDDSCKVCKCELYPYFVGRWRCIPCVLVEQAKSVSERQHYKIRYRPEYANRADARDLLYYGVSPLPLKHTNLAYVADQHKRAMVAIAVNLRRDKPFRRAANVTESSRIPCSDEVLL